MKTIDVLETGRILIQEDKVLNTIEDDRDKATLTAIQNGDRNAFADLYDRHCDWMLGAAYRILGNRRDAEDLLHDVFLEVWRKAAGYNPERGSVVSWLAVRVRSRALDRIRALARAREQVELPDDKSETSPQTHDRSTDAVEQLQARQAVKRLSPEQRTVIEFSYFQGLTCSEIAQHCKMPLGTVKSRLASAVAALRKTFVPLENPANDLR